MATVTEGKYPSDWLAMEQKNLYSRDEITVLAGSGSTRALTNGMVLGKITSSGKFVQVDDTASDGSETAAGVLFADITAPDGADIQATAIVRDGILKRTGLTWPSGFNTTTGEASLLALGLLTREDVAS